MARNVIAGVVLSRLPISKIFGRHICSPHIFTALLCVFYLGGLGAPSAEMRYGNTGLYEVSHNENNVCVAAREIRLEDGQSAIFGFGSAYIEGDVYGFVSVLDYDVEMREGQSSEGSVEIDSVPYFAFLLADSEQVLSAYISYDALKEIAYGSKLIIRAPAITYTVPLAGTLKAWKILRECIKDHHAREKFNPLGEASGRVGQKINPFGQTN